eukprot:COSAG02_NODE_124_length_35047_cov_31.554179_26_plen_267_part_00
MIVNELTVFASLTVRFLRGVCQVLRSAQRLTVSRPGLASARQRTPPLSRVASGGSPPPLRVGCAVLHWMASPAREGPASAGPYPPDAVEPLLLELRGMDEDSRLAAAGVGAAFAASFPSMPDEAFLSSLTAVQWSRVAAALQVPAGDILDIKDLPSSTATSEEKSRRLRGLVEERVAGATTLLDAYVLSLAVSSPSAALPPGPVGVDSGVPESPRSIKSAAGGAAGPPSTPCFFVKCCLLASLHPAPVLLWIGNPYYTLPPKAYDL